MENPTMQTPATTNQIESPKPSVSKTPAIITSPIGNSLNGGHYRTIHWQYVMAGQHIQKGILNLNIQMLTPKTPAYQKLTAKAILAYVPNERVWKNYLEYISQKGGVTQNKISVKPNFGGKSLAYANTPGPETYVPITNTTRWRDHWISSYIPRIGYVDTFQAGTPSEELGLIMPEYDALPARAFVAIYNDVLRNKEYTQKLTEYTEMDTVSTYEWESYMPSYRAEVTQIDLDVQEMRCRRNNSYYTNYRTELQGIDLETPSDTSDKALLNWASWESKIDLARQTSEDAQMRDIDILAKIRGSKKLSESRVQVLAEKTFDINYSAITQSAYNTNADIEEKFQVMGQQGAYSYTNISLPIGEDIMFLSDGTIHIIISITADTVFETAIPRRRTCVHALDEYRPELEDDKLDVIYEYEYGTATHYPGSVSYTGTLRFKRRFSEYYTGNPVIGGDMTTNKYYETIIANGDYSIDGTVVETNHTYQFYELDGKLIFNPTQSYAYVMSFKKVWLDYTDIAINANQAIMNEIEIVPNQDTLLDSIRVKGNNQIFMVGNYTISTTLPVTEKAKSNFSDWGEH